MIHIDKKFAEEAVERAYKKKVTNVEAIVVNESHDETSNSITFELGKDTVFIGTGVFYNFNADEVYDSEQKSLYSLMQSTGNILTIKERLTFTPQSGIAFATINLAGFLCHME